MWYDYSVVLRDYIYKESGCMSIYNDLVIEIENSSSLGFSGATNRLLSYVQGISRDDFKELLLDIGAIPQSIKPSSTMEKLYSKVTDIVLSRCFIEVGLTSAVLESRGNSADVTASSRYHGYSLVADSKAMRLSRTAKNQKDFKVGALGDNWIGDANTFAMLCCPLYQYPSKKSQIYEQALNNKSCFFSWEHFKFMIDRNVRETDTFSLEPIWSYATRMSRTITTNRDCNFFDKVNDNLCSRIMCARQTFDSAVMEYYSHIQERAVREKEKIEEDTADIRNLSREEAISILLEPETKKIDSLNSLISRLSSEEEQDE